MREYKLIGCTAIAKSAGDTEPQNAVLCLTVDDDGEVIRDSAIVFLVAKLKKLKKILNHIRQAANQSILIALLFKANL